MVGYDSTKFKKIEVVVFQIQDIDPKFYRSQTRKATLIVMAIFMVIGWFLAYMFPKWLGDYFQSTLTLNFVGAFVGLMITAFMTKSLFANKPWMHEAMYGWRLKRNLMHVTNRQRHILEAVEQGDQQAMKILRFYHLGLEQMHRLEDNSTSLIDVLAEKRDLEKKMMELGMDLNQTEFDETWVENYKEGAKDDDD